MRSIVYVDDNKKLLSIEPHPDMHLTVGKYTALYLHVYEGFKLAFGTSKTALLNIEPLYMGEYELYNGSIIVGNKTSMSSIKRICKDANERNIEGKTINYVLEECNYPVSIIHYTDNISSVKNNIKRLDDGKKEYSYGMGLYCYDLKHGYPDKDDPELYIGDLKKGVHLRCVLDNINHYKDGSKSIMMQEMVIPFHIQNVKWR